MTEAKHTPGPWQSCNYDGRCRVILGDDLRIAVVLGDHDESAANARLIAAAPDLLEALELWLSAADIHTFDDAKAKARATIARAKGGET
jgi:hypothetical protein